jgi:hypothetical protein
MFIANEISFETFEEKLNKLKTVYEMPKEWFKNEWSKRLES